MLIEIDEFNRISGDSYQWCLQRKRVRKNPDTGESEEAWESYSYHTNAGSACTELARREIRLHPATTLAEAENAIADVIRKYTAIFDPIANIEFDGTDTRNY